MEAQCLCQERNHLLINSHSEQNQNTAYVIACGNDNLEND